MMGGWVAFEPVLALIELSAALGYTTGHGRAMRDFSFRPFCPCDGHQAGLLYLAAGCGYTTRFGRRPQLQGQILDHGGWEIIAVTGKSGFQYEGLQEQGKSELPPRRFARQEGLLLRR